MGKSPRRLVVFNQKGGAKKTTTAVSLAAEFAAAGMRVRLIDCDGQKASATEWLPPQGTGGTDATPNLLHVLIDDVPIDEATWPTTVAALGIVPSYESLLAFEVQRPPGADLLLRHAVDDGAPVDMTIVDCPPNLGLLTFAAIAAADEGVITTGTSALDVAGIAALNQTITRVRRRLNPALRVTATVMCGTVTGTRIADKIAEQLAGDYPDAIHHKVRHAVVAQEAPGHHLTLRDYAPGSTATGDYAWLARRLVPDLRAA